MPTNIRPRAWADLGAGTRPSFLLRVGAVLLVVCAVARLGQLVAGLAHVEVAPLVEAVPWHIYVLTLGVLGFGFLALATRPFLGAVAFLPGCAHLLQAAFVLVVLHLVAHVAVFSAYPALLKYTCLAVFVVVEGNRLGHRTRNLVVAVVALASLKVLARVWELLPAAAALPLDIVLLVAQALATWRIARGVLFQENLWATVRLDERANSLADFNNPQRQAS